MRYKPKARIQAEMRVCWNTLHQIATGKRNTRERRLALSTIEFVMAMHDEWQKGQWPKGAR